jgi:biopolymer transport protein ExbB/TolQ
MTYPFITAAILAVEVPTPMDFWEYAKSQGPGWVVAFFAILAVLAVIREYSRREKFWQEREKTLVAALELKDSALDSEKDARREEALKLQQSVYETMGKLHDTIRNVEEALKKVNDRMGECHRRS